MSEIRTLRPGLLVSLNTSLKGNVHYQKLDLEGNHVTVNGEERARWETTRVISDPVEHKAATELRGKIRYLITSVCASSAFGLLCPEANADKLTGAIAEARSMADEFNANAALTRMSVNVLYGRIAQDDVEAVKAISEELRSLMEDMQEGLKGLDVKAVRDAANKAKGLGEMLSEDARGRLEVAITAARTSARKIAKAGETVAIAIDKRAIAQIDMARTSFLDIDIEAAMVAAPKMTSRSIDLVDEAVDALIAQRKSRKAAMTDDPELSAAIDKAADYYSN
jgi:hypothetical protein